MKRAMRFAARAVLILGAVALGCLGLLWLAWQYAHWH